MKSSPPPSKARRDESFLAFLVDQLGTLPLIDIRAMFGGYGLYSGSTFFGIIARSRLYFRTDEKSRQDYIQAGSGPFMFDAAHPSKSYYEVPVDVLEDRTRLLQWACRAITCARETKRPRRRSR